MSLLLRSLEGFFSEITNPGDRVLVAFSGGPDSTVLLWGLRQIASLVELDVHAAHLDHGLDAGSGRRATAAARLASSLETPLTVERLSHPANRPASESLEAYARQQRYAFLNRVADHTGAAWIATGHHADDQAETVLLRILYGSGIEGLGAMSKRRNRLIRPLIEHPRSELLQELVASGLEATEDPTNLDFVAERNRIRSRLLPHLESRLPGIAQRLCRLAKAARGARRQLERHLTPALGLRSIRLAMTGEQLGSAVDRQAFEALPQALQPAALALLHRQAGAPYPASSAARSELLRQTRRGRALGCDCGQGWRWEGDPSCLRLVKNASSFGDFAYTLNAPGSVDVPELALRVHLKRGPVSPWMFRGRATQAGLANIDLGTRQVVVRNRRIGDRIQPLGCEGRRRLKDLLIDRRIPRCERDRLPLLVIDHEVAWVPGITISEHYRLSGGRTAWIAAIEKLDSPKDNSPSPGFASLDESLTER